MREQMLRIQTRALDVALIEIRGRRLQNLENTHDNEALPTFVSVC